MSRFSLSCFFSKEEEEEEQEQEGGGAFSLHSFGQQVAPSLEAGEVLVRLRRSSTEEEKQQREIEREKDV